MSLQPGHTTSIFPNAGQAVLLVLAALFFQVCGGILVAAGAALAGQEWKSGAIEVLLNPWTLIAINTLAIGGTLAIGLRIGRESARAFFAPRPFPLRLLPSILLGSAGLAIVLAEADNIIVEILQALSWPGAEMPQLFNLEGYPFSGFLLLVVVAPVTEEYLFRGMILRGLLTRHRTAVAVGVTALLFGLIHANPRQLLVGFVIGGVFGWWYARTRSVVPCLAGHAVFNAVAWCAMLVPSEIAPFTHNEPGHPIVHQPIWFTSLGLVASGLALWWFDRLAILPAPPSAIPPIPAEPPLLAAEPPLARPPDLPTA
jgi:membrane protease YdiL (CAAX protease family)